MEISSIMRRSGTRGAPSNNDLSGEETTYAAEYSAAVSFDYTRSIGCGGMEFFLAGEANYKDEFSPAGDNDPLDRIDSYTKANLRFGLRGDSWEVMAFGRNIFDEEVYAQSFDVPSLAGSHARFIDEGAVFGARQVLFLTLVSTQKPAFLCALFCYHTDDADY